MNPSTNTNSIDSAMNFKLWFSVIENNLDYFCLLETNYSEEYASLLNTMLKLVRWYEIEIPKLKENLQRFDFDATTPGNGFRSFDIMIQRWFEECFVFCRELYAARGFWFCLWANVYLRKLKYSVRILEALKFFLNHVLRMIQENNSSFPLLVNDPLKYEEHTQAYKLLDKTAFYGQYQGYYFCSSMRRFIKMFSIVIAVCCDLYERNIKSPFRVTSLALINGMKYLQDSELRSRRIVNAMENCPVEFVQTLFNMDNFRFVKVLPNWIFPTLNVREELWIPAEALIIDTDNGLKTVHIPVPSSHIPSVPVRCLLMSYVQRESQYVKRKSTRTPAFLSPALVLHCHGGGFVSQSPELHEIYLRYWARDLNSPILSVDYSLSPLAPFPRALEEVLLTYVWALKNPEKLGWTGERICFVGDSAGGNMLMALVIRCIGLGIRKPDAIVCINAPLLLNITMSPSRLISWIDPILTKGFMVTFLDAYIGDTETANHEYAQIENSAHEKDRIQEVSECDAPHAPDKVMKVAADSTSKTSEDSFEPTLGKRIQEREPFEVRMALKNNQWENISRNPYMSPLCASDQVLREMPQVYLIALSFDSYLDDSITFAKRLRALGKHVVVDVLDGLPHGFVHLSPFSKEAHDGAEVCVNRIKEALKLSFEDLI